MKGKYWDFQVNPVAGCTPVSEACAHCYARGIHERFRAAGAGFYSVPFDRVVLMPEQLKRFDRLARTKKSHVVFVGNMSDLFHEQVPFEYIRTVFNYILPLKQHTFILLTKRPWNMKAFVDLELGDYLERTAPHIWLGTTCETQQRADERVPVLLQTPAAHRWISVEPMLGPINLEKLCCHDAENLDVRLGGRHVWPISLVICGGESGPKARPLHTTAAYHLKHQCDAAGVKFYWKQWGDGDIIGDSRAESDINSVRDKQVFDNFDYSKLTPKDIFI